MSENTSSSVADCPGRKGAGFLVPTCPHPGPSSQSPLAKAELSTFIMCLLVFSEGRSVILIFFKGEEKHRLENKFWNMNSSTKMKSYIFKMTYIRNACSYT